MTETEEVDPPAYDNNCPASYGHTPEPHRWTLDTADGVERCVKCAQRRPQIAPTPNPIFKAEDGRRYRIIGGVPRIVE